MDWAVVVGIVGASPFWAAAAVAAFRTLGALWNPEKN